MPLTISQEVGIWLDEEPESQVYADKLQNLKFITGELGEDYEDFIRS